jgi:hypothetical protein
MNMFSLGRIFPLLAVVSSAVAQPQPGQLILDSDYPAWLRYASGGPFYMAGPGDPEGFLYRGTRRADGTRDGDQDSLIAKLAGTGANCVYVIAVRSHGGDGGSTENPFIDSDPSKGVDTDIFDQWEEWFTALDESGVTIFLLIYDDSSIPIGKDLQTGGQLDPREAAFIDALVNRFKHHRHLIWCVAEEYSEGVTKARAVKIAERIRQRDEFGHAVAIHQLHGSSFDFNGQPAFQQFAVQLNVSTATDLHNGAVAARNNTGGLVNVNMAEWDQAGTGTTLRKKLWAIAMGGAYAMVYQMDIASTPRADLEACGRLVTFMESTRFHETAPRDDLAGHATQYVLADPGRLYIAYTSAAGTLGVRMEPGLYGGWWYDPIDGSWEDLALRTVSTAGVQGFTRPASVGEEAALYLVAAGVVAADVDADGDVDQEDYGRFQACLTDAPGMLTAPCAPLDMNRDAAVDHQDFDRFMACRSAFGVPLDPMCAASP